MSWLKSLRNFPLGLWLGATFAFTVSWLERITLNLIQI